MPVHRSKAAAPACALALLAACSAHDEIVTRRITLHEPAACASGPSAFGQYLALGDFQPAVEADRPLASEGASLDPIPAGTRALVVDVSDQDQEWWGACEVPDQGDVDVLLWPANAPCALTADVGARSGAALGVLSPREVLVVGGNGAGVVPGTFVADLATGAVTPLANGLLVPRTRASVTAFGGGGLVAGGARADGTLVDTAEVYAMGDFDRSPITLGGARADQGAVVLGTGETLLVGGVGPSGPLATMEVVDPSKRAARTERLASLAAPRIAPTVLRLASGEVLVAGGFEADMTPSPRLEWFDAKAASSSRRAQTLVARKRHAFVALPAGGALAVIAPDPSDVNLQSVWVISSDGPPSAAAPVTAPLGDVRLFDGADGRPLLWTGDRWMRWDPWRARFDEIAPGVPLRGPVDATIASPDAGLAVWLDGGRLLGMRFDTRGRFAPLLGALLADDTSFTAPDRLPAPGVVDFDQATGLTLAEGAQVFATDTTYAAVTIDVDAPTSEPPLVVLRDEAGNELAVGGIDCPLPASGHVHVERDGARVVANGAACKKGLDANARVSVGLRGQAPRSDARRLAIVRR